MHVDKFWNFLKCSSDSNINVASFAKKNYHFFTVAINVCLFFDDLNTILKNNLKKFRLCVLFGFRTKILGMYYYPNVAFDSAGEVAVALVPFITMLVPLTSTPGANDDSGLVSNPCSVVFPDVELVIVVFPDVELVIVVFS